MRRPGILLLAAGLVIASAGAASAEGETSTDTVLTTATQGALTITGGVVPTASVSAAIGATTGVTGSIMTVSDLRGEALGWDVTAKYVDPPATALLNSVSTAVTPLGASAVKVKTTAAATTTLTGALDYADEDFVALSASTGVNVANATAATSGGVTTFNTHYQVSVPSNATLGTVYGASVSYTVSPLVVP